jgi:hypothetical protein
VWDPIFCDEIRSKARDSLNAIVSELQVIETSNMPSFALCEQALLYAYLGLDKPLEGWHDKSLDYLNLAIERMDNSPPMHNGLYGGVAGVGWLLQHVITVISSVDDSEPRQSNEYEDDALVELDMHLLHQQKTSNSMGQNYDLITGLVGIGIYWLERLPRSRAILGIQQTVEALESAAIKTPLGTTWFTPPSLIPPNQKFMAPSGYYNLGVAHGVPGVIAFLSQAASLKLNPYIIEKALILLETSVKWLLAQQRAPGSASRYSCWTSPQGEEGDSRVAWCYGDLGIAGILQLSARCMQNPIWMREANSLANECARRTAKVEVSDAPLCHGALGIAHIYNRIYQVNGDDIFKQAAITWTLKGIAMRRLCCKVWLSA